MSCLYKKLDTIEWCDILNKSIVTSFVKCCDKKFFSKAFEKRRKQKIKDGIMKTIDLCSGIGGIRRGFELAGDFENVLSAEKDEYACRTYQHLFGDDPRHDVTDEAFKDLVAQTRYDVLLAGFPCQAFSRIGLKQGFRDVTKGTIFFDIAEIIDRTMPKVVFLENVENLVSHNKGQTFRIIINTLEKN